MLNDIVRIILEKDLLINENSKKGIENSVNETGKRTTQ